MSQSVSPHPDGGRSGIVWHLLDGNGKAWRAPSDCNADSHRDLNRWDLHFKANLLLTKVLTDYLSSRLGM